MTEKMQKTVFWAIIATESSHVFCCVLPTIFSVMSLMAGLGLAVMPVWLEDMHAGLHDWELPLIVLSGAVILLGWGLHYYSQKIDCHDTGCEHGACAPRKKTANGILKFATLLFFINIAIYGVFHRGMSVWAPVGEVSQDAHQGHNH